MKKILLFCIFMAISIPLCAQKITFEPGIGLAGSILTSGGSQSGESQNSVGIALQAGLHYHFNSQYSLGLFALAQDGITGSEFSSNQEIRFSPAHSRTRILSVNGRYAFSPGERRLFFFIGLDLGVKNLRYNVQVNDVDTISRTSFAMMPEFGIQAQCVQFVLSFTAPVASPTIDQVSKDDGIRYVMDRGFVSTLQLSIRYQFRLFGRE